MIMPASHDQQSQRTLYGFAMLVDAVVGSCFHSTVVYEKKQTGKRKRNMVINYEATNKRRALNRAFAKSSAVLHHWCDVFEYDYARTQRAIIRRNLHLSRQ